MTQRRSNQPTSLHPSLVGKIHFPMHKLKRSKKRKIETIDSEPVTYQNVRDDLNTAKQSICKHK